MPFLGWGGVLSEDVVETLLHTPTVFVCEHMGLSQSGPHAPPPHPTSQQPWGSSQVFAGESLAMNLLGGHCCLVPGLNPLLDLYAWCCPVIAGKVSDQCCHVSLAHRTQTDFGALCEHSRRLSRRWCRCRDNLLCRRNTILLHWSRVWQQSFGCSPAGRPLEST